MKRIIALVPLILTLCLDAAAPGPEKTTAKLEWGPQDSKFQKKWETIYEWSKIRNASSNLFMYINDHLQYLEESNAAKSKLWSFINDHKPIALPIMDDYKVTQKANDGSDLEFMRIINSIAPLLFGAAELSQENVHYLKNAIQELEQLQKNIHGNPALKNLPPARTNFKIIPLLNKWLAMVPPVAPRAPLPSTAGAGSSMPAQSGESTLSTSETSSAATSTTSASTTTGASGIITMPPAPSSTGARLFSVPQQGSKFLPTISNE